MMPFDCLRNTETMLIQLILVPYLIALDMHPDFIALSIIENWGRRLANGRGFFSVQVQNMIPIGPEAFSTHVMDRWQGDNTGFIIW